MAGRSERPGITWIQLFDMFPDEDSARTWFEETRWPDGRACGKCGSVETSEVPHEKPMPYWCKDCRSYFSVKTGTVMQSSKLPMRAWVIAIFQTVTNLKGVSSTKAGRDLGISQQSAWFMMHRIREAMRSDDPLFRGPVEADETYIGGKESTKHESERLHAGRGAVGKAPVVGVRDRETGQVSVAPIDRTDRATLQEFVHSRTDTSATVTRTKQGPISDSGDLMRRSGIARVSTSMSWPLPMAWNRSGPVSNLATRVSITGSVSSTCTATSANSREHTTTGRWTRWTR